jgi:hypothetical protein
MMMQELYERQRREELLQQVDRSMQKCFAFA